MDLYRVYYRRRDETWLTQEGGQLVFLYNRIFANLIFTDNLFRLRRPYFSRNFASIQLYCSYFFWTTSLLFILVDLNFAGKLVCNALFADLVFLKIYSLVHSWHYFSVQILYNNQRSDFSYSDEQIWHMLYNIVLPIEQMWSISGMQSKLLQPLTVQELGVPPVDSPPVERVSKYTIIN